MREESSARREQLLRETRNYYKTNGTMPAVHPRYRAAYHYVEEDRGVEHPSSSLGIRIFLAMLLFALYAAAGEQGKEIGPMTTGEIAEQIQTDLDFLSPLLQAD